MLSSILVASLASLAAARPPHPRQGSACADIPSTISLPNTPYLPNPFINLAGKPVKTAKDFACRQQEISQLFQRYELGALPPKPESVTGSYANNTLTIVAANGNKSVTFPVTITYPTTGSGPFPAFIGIDGGSIPIPANVAQISFPSNTVALQTDSTSRGQGVFYDLYGRNATAGALMAWAWGISRVIDVLEQTPSANINTKRLGVTGCSRDGKGALVAGAFEPRIALTIPQESGSGGDDSWRISDYIGSNITQTLGEIVGENVWFSTALNQFVGKTNSTPFDHHQLIGLVAPRGYFGTGNSDYVWLGGQSAYGAEYAANLIYKALGAEANHGFNGDGNHAHCTFPADQVDSLNAFIGKFLLDQKNTTTGGITATTNFTNGVDLSYWVPWETEVPTIAK